MSKALIVAGGLMCAVAVATGAFGAHALASKLDARALELWETAGRYFMYAGFGVLASALLSPHCQGAGALWAGGLLIAGGVIFAGAVGGLALGAPRILGAVAPIGGSAMIAGFLVLAYAGWTSSPN